MQKLLEYWCFYGLGHDEYKKSMKEAFVKNISSLRWANIVVAVLAGCFSLFPIIIEKNNAKSVYYFGTAFVAILLYLFVMNKYHQYQKGKQISQLLIYILIILYYANIISFGIYLGVWANPGKLAVSFIAILICALFPFNNPPILNLCLIFMAMIFFIISAIWIKIPSDWSIDVVNALFAGALGQILTWQITMNRVSLTSAINKLKEERNTYYDQSMIDELTKLKNRRDFMATFQRFLSRYRESDTYLCLAIIDIDYFKNYNDFYGHPKGDDCLRKIGEALNSLQKDKSIYAARIGGEEFALLWFEYDSANADNVASLVNKMIFDLQIQHEKSMAAKYVTVSIGIHIAECGAYHEIQTLYDSADKALYTAKQNGRNRAVIL